MGNAVLASAKTLKHAALSRPVEAFRKAHASYLAAEAKVEKADEAVRRQSRAVGEADAVQDAAVMKLADALVADGLPRLNPFKPLGFASPSNLTRLRSDLESPEVLRLADAVLGRTGVGKAALGAAKALAAAARAVDGELKSLPALVDARAAAMRERDTLGRAWEASLASLKLATRVAQAEGATGAFAALFSDDKPSRPRRRKTPAPPAPPAS